jgi:hypothetical protein
MGARYRLHRAAAMLCLLALAACGRDEADYDGSTTLAVHDAAEADAERLEAERDAP